MTDSAIDVVGIDHVYIAVSDMTASERFYDMVMSVLGFRKNRFSIADDEHIQYYNRHFGFVLRPAKSKTIHDAYAPGLHHFCLRVDGEKDVIDVAAKLKRVGITVSDAKRYPEYAPDYMAVFFTDPDGIRLEITNYRQERRRRHDEWEK